MNWTRTGLNVLTSSTGHSITKGKLDELITYTAWAPKQPTKIAPELLGIKQTLEDAKKLCTTHHEAKL